MAKNFQALYKDFAALSKEEAAWLDKVCALLEQDRKHQWVIGDALLEGERYVIAGGFGAELHAAKKQAAKNTEPDGEEHKVPYQLALKGHNPIEEVAKRSGYDESSLKDFMRVARAFPTASKRVAGLSWSHHQACAAEWLTEKQREVLLDRAENNHWSVNTLRQEVLKKNTDEFAGAKDYKSLSFRLPQSTLSKLKKIAKQEERKVDSLLEEAVGWLLDEYAGKKKSKAA
jgi:hypothetical protein